MIKVIVLGKLKENYLNLLVNDYVERIRKYHKLELFELKDLEDLDKEAINVLKYIGVNDYVITLEIEGKLVDSREFANILDKTFITNSTITFVVGSSMGLHQKVKSRSNLAISFGKVTYPHGLFRGILLEQIYRAFKINKNENYHK